MSLTQELIALIRAKPVTDQDLEKAAMFTLDALACAYAGSNTLRHIPVLEPRNASAI